MVVQRYNSNLLQVPYVATEHKAKVEDEEYMEDEASSIEVGARCEVEGGRRGVVRFVGKCEGLPLGYWVGVQVRLGLQAGGGCVPCCWAGQGTEGLRCFTAGMQQWLFEGFPASGAFWQCCGKQKGGRKGQDIPLCNCGCKSGCLRL